ncbi:MAG TPA: hypothetical protein VGE74_30435 [Gemmata sp.]
MTTEVTETTRQEMLDKVKEIIGRARRGDAAVVPLLRELMDRHPALWQQYGDLAADVERAWIALAGGTDLLVRESRALYAAKLRGELARPSAQPVERLLVERAVATWLQLQYFSGIEAADLDQRASPKLLEYRGRRQAQAQRMHEKALAALLVVQKLFPAPAVLPPPVATSTPTEAEQRQDAPTERERVLVGVTDPVEADAELSRAQEQVRVTC